MNSFELYLEKEGLKPNTVQQHRRYVEGFKGWMSSESLAITAISYSDVLDYADHLQKEGCSTGYVNRVLLSIRYYFSWLQQSSGVHNPAAGIRLKGAVRGIPHGLLEKAELDGLYEGYVVKDDRSQRNKVMLSLLIYQGITNEEMHHLKADHIQLKEGKIRIAAMGGSNSRTLKLEAFQIMELHEYLTVTRVKILAGSTDNRPGRKPEMMKPAAQISQLFISMNGSENLKNSLLHFNYALRKLNPKYKNAAQIRQSVITEWLKEKDLRTVQYMAGHKYVSSTERYQTTNLEDLKEALNKHHPLK
ncbi:site-specific integrase [Pedobacter sp. FW305-3-2-15-E-R2A2]|uniref:tyrosine-type recombinase/integrase n=1 Tax=Pedobacter sp. FW305-3-2-15-E-R2A2 TaxID=3140251 RepID=UPI003140BBEE